MLKMLIMCLFIISGSAYSFDMNVGGGLLYNIGDVDASGVDINSKPSLQVGLISKKEINSELTFRTGALYTRKSVEYDIKEFDLTIDLFLDYLTIPLTIEYVVSGGDLSLIGGLNFQLKISDDCDAGSGTCEVTDANSTVIPLVLGLSKKFNDEWFGEATYEYALGESSESLKISSLVFNVFYKL